MKLYGYHRSSAAYRVRIALNLKGLKVEQEPVHLLEGAHREETFLSLNPQGRIPVLVDGDLRLSQSMAILEYLDESHPSPALLPNGRKERAMFRSMAQLIVSDVHPLNNSSVLTYLREELGAGDKARDRWYAHWIRRGFEALEVQLADKDSPGPYVHGAEPGLVDVVLVPQVYNAERFSVSMDGLERISFFVANARRHDAFVRAAPHKQPDAPSEDGI